LGRIVAGCQRGTCNLIYTGASNQYAAQAIRLNPSSVFGHKGKHAALLGARRYTEAIDAYDDMLLMLEQSADPVTRGKYYPILYESVV